MSSFLVERRHWLRVETVDRPNGGWDVVLVIDGTYYDGQGLVEKAALVHFFTQRIREELEDIGA